MRNKRNEMPVWLKTVFIVVTIVFVLCLMAAVVFVALCSCGKITVGTGSQVLDMSTLLTFLALAFCIATATPYFITDNKIDSAVRKFVKQEFEPDIINRSEEVTKLDAHLSRMVAFTLLGQHYYAWSVGWSFRALKRYTELHSEYTDLYKEFHVFVFNNIIIKALNEIESKKNDTAETILGEAEAYKITLRAVKDYIDFRYKIHKYSTNEPVRTMKNDFRDVIDEISRKMQFVILFLYENCPLHDFDSSIDGFFFKASRYKQDGDELRAFFYEAVWNKLPFEKDSFLSEDRAFQEYHDSILKKYNLSK